MTDSVFSMDGDVAHLTELARLRRAFGALLLVDEAHATLVHGAHGGGAVEQVGECASVRGCVCVCVCCVCLCVCVPWRV